MEDKTEKELPSKVQDEIARLGRLIVDELSKDEPDEAKIKEASGQMSRILGHTED